MKGDPTKPRWRCRTSARSTTPPARSTARKQYWDSAIKANGKLVAARINMLASLELEQMRKIGNSKDATWKKLEEDARFNLSNVLGVDTDNVEAYTAYGLVYMEGWQDEQEPPRPREARCSTRRKKRNEKFAPLQNAYGLYYMHRGALNRGAAARSRRRSRPTRSSSRRASTRAC